MPILILTTSPFRLKSSSLLASQEVPLSISSILVATMAGMLESEAYFTGRLSALKLMDFAPKFAAKEWTTVNAFAFSNSYVPGRADESVLAEKVFKTILGGLDHAKEHAVRRLFYESHLMATSEVQRRITNPEEEGKAPRKLPIEERGQR